MLNEKEVYANHAIEYEALISREDYQGNILKSIQEIVPLEGLDILDLGAGTGRLACLLAPHVRSVLSFDLLSHMLGIARDKLHRFTRDNWLVAASDHRFLPLKTHSADLIVSGWSVSYIAVWNPLRWREEACRVLRPNGFIILFESLGTGDESPQRLPHLENSYNWLDEVGFKNKWIRTDVQFKSLQTASDMAGFFFGDEMKQRIISKQLTILPECTGVWWMIN